MEPTSDLPWMSLVTLSVVATAGLLATLTAPTRPGLPPDGPPGQPPARGGSGSAGARGAGRIARLLRRLVLLVLAARGRRRVPESEPACRVELEDAAEWCAGSGEASRALVLAAAGLALGLLTAVVARPSAAPARGATEAVRSPAPVEAPGSLGVGLTFQPAEATPGQAVRIDLSPPFPAEVHLGGTRLPAEIRSGGRTLIVHIPDDFPSGPARLALVARGRQAVAAQPLRIVDRHRPAPPVAGLGARAPRPGGA